MSNFTTHHDERSSVWAQSSLTQEADFPLFLPCPSHPPHSTPLAGALLTAGCRGVGTGPGASQGRLPFGLGRSVDMGFSVAHMQDGNSVPLTGLGCVSLPNLYVEMRSSVLGRGLVAGVWVMGRIPNEWLCAPWQE